MGSANGRLTECNGNTTASHDSDASLSAISVDFTLTPPPKARKSVSFQELEDSFLTGVESFDESEGDLDSFPSHRGPLLRRPVPCPLRDSDYCCCCCCTESYDRPDDFSESDRTSPGNDLGYDTLLSHQTSPSRYQSPKYPLFPTPTRNFLGVNTQQLKHTQQFLPSYKGKKNLGKSSPFDRLCDDVILKIFSYLSTNQLCLCARVCRRWYFLAWEPRLWSTVELTGQHTNADRALRTLMRLLCRDSPSVCLTVETVVLNGCTRLTDKGLVMLTQHCPELRRLELISCSNITNLGILELTRNCLNLEHLDLTGCYQVNCIEMNDMTSCAASTIQPLSSQKLQMKYLNLTDCHNLSDSGLKFIVRICPNLQHLYLRRCINLSDTGMKHVANFCLTLKELSISDCVRITDFGLYKLAKLGSNLRYLSVAKCSQISDAGIKHVARHCYKLRYLNVRGCEAVSDDSMELLAQNCPRLRALDIGKCDVTDYGLKMLSEHCPNLKKLSVKSCDMITDKGIQSIAYYCRGLQQLNLQDCQVSGEGYRTIKNLCKKCIIEHTNPGFY